MITPSARKFFFNARKFAFGEWLEKLWMLDGEKASEPCHGVRRCTTKFFVAVDIHQRLNFVDCGKLVYLRPCVAYFTIAVGVFGVIVCLPV